MITNPGTECLRTEATSVRVLVSRIFPSLGKSTIVPDVTSVREDVVHHAELAVLDVLLDGVAFLTQADFHLGVGATGNLHNHVQHTLVLLGIKRDVVKVGDEITVLL